MTRRTPGGLDLRDCAFDFFGIRRGVEPLGDPKSITRAIPTRATPEVVGVFSGFVTFATDSARSPSLAIPVTIRVLPAWQPSPAGVVIDDAHPAGWTFSLRPRGHDDRRVPHSTTVDDRVVDAVIRRSDSSTNGHPEWTIEVQRPELLCRSSAFAWLRVLDEDARELSRVLITRPIPHTR